MASLDSTERAKVALAAGESLIVTTTGQCTVQGLSGAPSSTTTLTANSQTFGPYGVSAVLLVTNVSGRTDYVANNATFELNRTEKAAFDALVSGAGNRAKKAPQAQIGGGAPLSLSDITILAGSPTVTIEAGPNGQPAIKVVTGVGTNAELALPGLVGARFDGECYMALHGSRTQGNLDYVAVLMSQDDGTYAKGTNTFIQYGLTAPLQSSLEQGGANTYWWRKGGARQPRHGSDLPRNHRSNQAPHCTARGHVGNDLHLCLRAQRAAGQGPNLRDVGRRL